MTKKWAVQRSTPYRVCTGPSIPKVGTKVTTADVTKAQLTGFLLGGGPIVCHRGQSGTEGDRRNYPTGRHYQADHTRDGHDRRSRR